MEHKFVYNKISLTPNSLYLVRDNYSIRPVVVTEDKKIYEISSEQGTLGKEMLISDIREVIFSTYKLSELMKELAATVGERNVKYFSIDPKKLKPGVKVKLSSLKLTAEITKFADNKDGTYEVSLKFDSVKDAEKYLGKPIEEVYAYRDLSDPTIDEVWSKDIQLNYWELA